MTENKKRPKSHFVTKAKKQRSKYSKLGLSDIKNGMKGVLVTANFLGAKCKSEVFQLLEGMYEREFGEDNTEVTSTGDVADDIANEIADIKAKKSKMCFQAVDTTLNNILFIAVMEERVDVTDLMRKIMLDLKENRLRKTRFTQRVLPVTHTCYASIEDITKTARSMLEGIFYNDVKKTFAIVFKSRNNSAESCKREPIIKAVATVATDDEKYAESNKVNLDNAEYTIIINILKNVVFMSVVKDFNLFSKYNIDELTKGFYAPKRRDGERGSDVEEDQESEDKGLVKENDVVKTSEEDKPAEKLSEQFEDLNKAAETSDEKPTEELLEL